LSKSEAPDIGQLDCLDVAQQIGERVLNKFRLDTNSNWLFSQALPKFFNFVTSEVLAPSILVALLCISLHMLSCNALGFRFLDFLQGSTSCVRTAKQK
jgi:hypothetical protein